MKEFPLKAFGFDRYLLLAILLIAGFILFKIPVLSLPYFWDEAWSYMPAISQLNRAGLSLLPGAIPADVYRGHPLLFYFLGAVWMKIFGNSFVSMHSFALLITCSLLAAIFLTGRNLFSPATGIVAMIVFIFQPVVLGQAAFVLPEMLMAFWSLCCIYCFIKNNLFLYVIFATCLLYTKESGIILVISIIGWQIIRTVIDSGNKILAVEVRRFITLFLPVLFVCIYFLIQKKIMGWYFFPDHIRMISHEMHEVNKKIILCINLAFVDQRRVIVCVIAILFFILYSLKSLKKKGEIMKMDERHFFLLASIFILFYLIFCAINFFTYRYLLSVTAIWSILVAAPIVWFSGENKFTLIGIVCLIIFVFYLENDDTLVAPKNRISTEFNLGFKDAVIVQKQICDYLQDGAYRDKKIFGTFLYSFYLTNHDAGYLHNERALPNIIKGFPCQAEYIIYSSIEQDPDFPTYSRACELTLVKRFESGYAWAELYKRNTEADGSKKE